MNEKEIHYCKNSLKNKTNIYQRELYRPNINFKKAFLIICITIAITTFISCAVSKYFIKMNICGFNSKNSWQAFLDVYIVLQLVVILITFKYIMIWFIRIYQRYAKAETRLRCCYTPSCSEYAILALKKYGVFIGGIKAIRRLLRCGSSGGIDYP